MIYIKIYLDKDENGEDMLVFDSAKKDDRNHFFTVAGEKTRKRLFTKETWITMPKRVWVNLSSATKPRSVTRWRSSHPASPDAVLSSIP